MKIQPIYDNNTDFNLVELADDGKVGRLTPHCKIHRAMHKVSIFEHGGGYWRCCTSDGIKCRAGCIQLDNPFRVIINVIKKYLCK